MSAGSFGAPTPTPRSSSFCNPRRMWLAEVGGGFELLRRETHLPRGSRFKASLRELPGEAFPSWVTQRGACPSLGKGEAFTLLLYGWERYFLLIFKGLWDSSSAEGHSKCQVLSRCHSGTFRGPVRVEGVKVLSSSCFQAGLATLFLHP